MVAEVFSRNFMMGAQGGTLRLALILALSTASVHMHTLYMYTCMRTCLPVVALARGILLLLNKPRPRDQILIVQ